MGTKRRVVGSVALWACTLLMSCSLPGCQLWARLTGGGAAGDKPGGAPRGASIELSDELCSSLGVPTRLSLVGLDPKERGELRALAQRQVVAVRFAAEGCYLKLLALERCELEASYRWQVGAEAELDVVRDAESLYRELPLAAREQAGALKDGQGFMRRTQRSAVLRIKPEAGVRKQDLKDGPCRRATHVISELHLGRFAAMAGPEPSVSAYAQAMQGGGAAIPPPDVKPFDEVGDGAACARALKRGAVLQGCDQPIAIALTPVEAFDAKGGRAKMVTVPAGSYRVGKKKVRLGTFQIDETEVTAGAYAGCVARGSCTAAGDGRYCTAGALGKAGHPVNCVTWKQAQAYCGYAGKRLPTAAEWEAAARGKQGAPFPWGSAWPPPAGAANLADDTAGAYHAHWHVVEGYDDGQVGPAPAELSKVKSPFGARQMGGNLMEWTADDAKKRRSKARVVKGASFGESSRERAEAAYPRAIEAERASMHIGFRCAVTGAPKPKPKARAASPVRPAPAAPTPEDELSDGELPDGELPMGDAP